MKTKSENGSAETPALSYAAYTRQKPQWSRAARQYRENGRLRTWAAEHHWPLLKDCQWDGIHIVSYTADADSAIVCFLFGAMQRQMRKMFMEGFWGEPRVTGYLNIEADIDLHFEWWVRPFNVNGSREVFGPCPISAEKRLAYLLNYCGYSIAEPAR